MVIEKTEIFFKKLWISEKETYLRACNRNKNSIAQIPEADFWVSLEGGLREVDENQMEVLSYVVVQSKNMFGKAKSATFILLKQVTELVRQGYELSQADNMVFERENSKQTNGTVGLLTNNLITRTSYYKQAIILALIPFLNAKLYT